MIQILSVNWLIFQKSQISLQDPSINPEWSLLLSLDTFDGSQKTRAHMVRTDTNFPQMNHKLELSLKLLG